MVREREDKGYLFDTTPCIRLRKGDPKISEGFKQLQLEAEIYVSVITVGELFHYIFKAPIEHQKALGEIVAKPPSGQFIGQNDCWIAAYGKQFDFSH